MTVSNARMLKLVPTDPARMAAALDVAAASARSARFENEDDRSLALELATRLEAMAAAAHVLARSSGTPAEAAAIDSLYGATESSVATRSAAERRCPPGRGKAAPATGRLPPETLQQVIRSHFGEFRACYEMGLRDDPHLEGRVTIRFVIGRDGRVAAVGTPKVQPSNLDWTSSERAPPMPDPLVVSCVADAFAHLVFPRPEGGIVTVVYPILFSPSDPAPPPRPAPAETR